MTIPTELAGRTVLATATVEPASNAGHPRIRGADSENPQIRFLAITTEGCCGEEEFYLFHCDDGWNVIWDSWHSEIWLAVRQARWEYGDHVRFFPGLDESPPAGWS